MSKRILNGQVASFARSKHQLWQCCLIAIGSASSLVYPHAPLVSFATLAGITLNRKPAVITALLIWLVNQFSGFTLRQYPVSTIALLWGITMGLGTIAVALIASLRPRFSARHGLGQGVWLAIAWGLGFVIYNSSIWVVNQWVGMHGFTADVWLRMFGRDLVWAIGLFGLYLAVHRPHLWFTHH